MDVTLREISETNFVEAIRLEVAPDQKRFVAPNAVSIAQSKFHTFLECYGIYEDETMVGFCAFGLNPGDGEAWIARLMVGADFQRRGYGSQAVRLLVDHMQRRYECSSILLDIEPENVAACRLYEGAGFTDTGKTQGQSRIFRRDLSSGGA